MFFVILVVVDPMVVVLLGLVRREGSWLACGVMVLDVAANWAGNWVRIRHDPGLNVPWVITLLGGMWRGLSRGYWDTRFRQPSALERGERACTHPPQ